MYSKQTNQYLYVQVTAAGKQKVELEKVKGELKSALKELESQTRLGNDLFATMTARVQPSEYIDFKYSN